MNTLHPHGLKKLSTDKRDLRLGQLFKLPAVSELPDDFIVSLPLEIKDQRQSDFCTAFASCAVSEDQEGVTLDPLWQFMKIKQDEGDPASWGADLRQAAQALVNHGSIEESESPYTIDTPRDVIVSPDSWKDKDYDTLAAKHKKASYMFVTGDSDFFDNIRRTLYYFRDEKRSCLMGTEWCAEWLSALAGVISSIGTPVAGHAVKGMGWRQKNGQPYLVLQLSSGKEVGDGGLFYLSREVVNAQKDFGAIVFSDIPKEVLQAHQDYGVRVDMNPLLKIIIAFCKDVYRLYKKYHG